MRVSNTGKIKPEGEEECPFPCRCCCALGEVNAVVVVGPEGGVALGALAVACFVARLQAVEAENVETLRQDGVFLVCLARRTGQLILKQRQQQHYQ